MCFYWKLIIELMLDVLIFIRSIREGNFLLYTTMLRQLIKWFFIFDHYHYARWISIHLYDLFTLPQLAPHLHKSFMDGYFTFQNTDRQYSLIGLDQVREQNNAVMKGMGGVTSLVNREDESSLARWGLCIHVLASIIDKYENEEKLIVLIHIIIMKTDWHSKKVFQKMWFVLKSLSLQIPLN